jgi:hypothetical protein
MKYTFSYVFLIPDFLDSYNVLDPVQQRAIVFAGVQPPDVEGRGVARHVAWPSAELLYVALGACAEARSGKRTL